jgi:hypothetical protein
MTTHHIKPITESHDSPCLLAFNVLLLEQALALAAAHVGPELGTELGPELGSKRPRYAGLVGSHLRHVIEHFEALLFPAVIGSVDYDTRPRDADLDASPHVARTRLQALQAALTATSAASFAEPLQVLGQGGLEGECSFRVTSSLGRELAFVASHTVHHFALLANHCQQQGIPTPEGFGKAPATRAHERAKLKLACA